MNTKSVALFASAAVLLTACGGGGGGGGDDLYDGKTTPASIADGTAAVSLTGTVIDSAMGQVSMVEGYVPSSSEKSAKSLPRVVEDDYCGGTVDYTETATTFSATFSNYDVDGYNGCDGNFLLNGKMAGEWSSNAEYEQASVTFTAFRIYIDPNTFGYDGSMVLRDYYSAQYQATANFVLTLNNAAVVKAENFSLTADASGNPVAVSGKYYMAEAGYVVFATTENLAYGTCIGMPHDGILTVTSAEGTWAMDIGQGYIDSGSTCGVVKVTSPSGTSELVSMDGGGAPA